MLKLYMNFRRQSFVKRFVKVCKELRSSIRGGCELVGYKEKENLCLYGYSNGTWEVSLPVEEVPAHIPEPALGINFARDGMDRQDWLLLVAAHSDSWLLSVAYFFGAEFTQDERNRLFLLINELPTIVEVVMNNKSAKGKKSKRNSKRAYEKDAVKVKVKVEKQKEKEKEREREREMEKVEKQKQKEKEKEREREKVEKEKEKEKEKEMEMEMEMEEEMEEKGEDDDDSNEKCGECKANSIGDGFWIGCDFCENWYHGECVKITAAKAKKIKQYKCPSCQSNGARK